MKKTTIKWVSFLLLLGTAGCFSLESASLTRAAGEGLRLHAGAGAPVAHAVVSNDGWYLFNLWPLATGNTKDKNERWFPFSLFRDNVQEGIIHGKLTKFAKEKGCDVADLALLSNEQVLLSIPGTNLPLPIPYIATYRRMQISAVLVEHAKVSTVEFDAARRRAMSRELKLLLNEIPNGNENSHGDDK